MRSASSESLLYPVALPLRKIAWKRAAIAAATRIERLAWSAGVNASDMRRV